MYPRRVGYGVGPTWPSTFSRRRSRPAITVPSCPSWRRGPRWSVVTPPPRSPVRRWLSPLAI